MDVKTDIDAVLSQYSGMVYKLAMSRTHNREDADDIFQEVFLKYMEYADALQSEEHKKAWLLRVTMNCCNKLYASKWKKRVVMDDSLILLAREGKNLLETIEDTQVYDAVAALPERYRSVIHLFYYEEMTIQEIERILGKKEGTIKSLLHRGKKLLEKKLQGYEW